MFKLTQRKKEILFSEVDYEYSRSSGPGGQKVNKTETQVGLRWRIEESSAFNEEQKKRIREKLSNRINREGELVLQLDKYRTRIQNQKNSFKNLVELLEQALTRPKPRLKTKPTRASKEKRLKDKKAHSDKKKNRQKWQG